MVGSTALGLFILEAMGSVVVETGITSIFDKIKIKYLSFKVNRAFKKEIESIKNDENQNHSPETIIELNRLKANIYSFRPVINDYSALSKLPLKERKKEFVKILTEELSDNYDIPESILENMVIKFVNITYEKYNQFIITSEKEWRKEVSCSISRIENNTDPINSFDQNNLFPTVTEFHCPLKKQITHIISDNEKLKEENLFLKLQPYIIYFEQAVKAETENNYNEAILQSENLLNKIAEDRKKYQEGDYWNEFSLNVMEYECFAYINLSKYHTLSQEHLKSLDYLQKSLFIAERIKTSDKFLAGIYTNYAILLATLEKDEEAGRYYDKAIKLYPKSFEIYNNYAILLTKLDEKDKAENYYKEAIRLNPKNPIIYNNYTILLKAFGRYEEAEKIYEKLIEINPEYPVAHNNYANYLASSSKNDTAEIHYNEAIRLKPDYFEAYTNYGNYLAAHERYGEAKEKFEKAIEINPKYHEAQNNYGVILKRNGETEKAEIHYKEAIKLNPKYYQAYANYAILLTELGRYYEAENNYLKVIELNPNFFWTYVFYADLLVHFNRIDEADLYFKKATDLHPNIPEIYLRHVNFLLKIKKEDNLAYNAYLEALQICPNVANYPNPFLKD